MSDGVLRELERKATTPGGVLDLIRHLAREGMFFFCEECGACVPPMARDRHEYEHDYERTLEAEAERIEARNKEEWSDYESVESHWTESRSSGMRVVRIPPRAPHACIAARPKNEPLYHRTFARPGTTVRFFENTLYPHGSSNLETPGHLPAGSHFYIYGLSIIPDEGTRPDALEAIRNEGTVWLLTGAATAPTPSGRRPSLINNDLPARAVVSQRHFLASEVLADHDLGLDGLVPMHRISIRGKPLELSQLQCFRVDLALPNWPPGLPVSLTCILHGLRLTGVMG